jgi:hypothetical protein
MVVLARHLGSRVTPRSKALHLSARSVTTDPGLTPGCITTSSDWELLVVCLGVMKYPPDSSTITMGVLVLS